MKLWTTLAEHQQNILLMTLFSATSPCRVLSDMLHYTYNIYISESYIDSYDLHFSLCHYHLLHLSTLDCL